MEIYTIGVGGAEVLLSVGLTRAFSTGGFPPVHWLQVNNIHFRKNPLWNLVRKAT